MCNMNLIFVFSPVFIFTHAAIPEWPSIHSDSFSIFAPPFTTLAATIAATTTAHNENSFVTRSTNSNVSSSAVKKHQLPFVATLIPQNMPSKYGICGGTVVSSNYVLTSASCCGCGDSSMSSDSYFEVIINSFHYNYTNGSPAVQTGFDECTEYQTANQFICHPNWAGSSTPNSNNFCLIYLQNATDVAPVQLYNSAVMNFSPESVGALAYGTRFFDLDSLYTGFIPSQRKMRSSTDIQGDYEYEYISSDNFPYSPLIADTLQKSSLILRDINDCASKHMSQCTNRVPAPESGCYYCPNLEPSLTLCAKTQYTTTHGTDVFGDLGSPLFIPTASGFVQIGVLNDFDLSYSTIYSRIDTPSFKSWVSPFVITQQPTTSLPTTKTPPTTKSPPTKKLPTTRPTKFPTTLRPTKFPTFTPTKQPTRLPTTKQPTNFPSSRPTLAPTPLPTTREPTITKQPPTTKFPTPKPTKQPTKSPTTKKPTFAPTRRPSKFPTPRPTRPTKRPTVQPSTLFPTQTPNAPTRCMNNVFP